MCMLGQDPGIKKLYVSKGLPMINSCPICSNKMSHLSTFGYVCRSCGYMNSGLLDRGSASILDF